MLIAIIGENCVGKSTLAEKINEKLGAKIYAGKDYLRLEKNSSMALNTFKTVLQEAVHGEDILYIITEKEHVQLLPEGAFRIVLTADLEVIQERFKARMRGNLPAPVAKMLEMKHGMYDDLECHLKLDAGYSMEDVFGALHLE